MILPRSKTTIKGRIIVDDRIVAKGPVPIALSEWINQLRKEPHQLGRGFLHYTYACAKKHIESQNLSLVEGSNARQWNSRNATQFMPNPVCLMTVYGLI